MGQKVHEMISDLKEVARTLGRTPSRDEYVTHGRYSKNSVAKVFGGYGAFTIAAGLQKVESENRESKKKRINKFYEYDFKAKEPKKLNKQTLLRKYPKILVAPDVHAPWWSVVGVSAFIALVEHLRPDYVLQLGDFFDFYSFSSHAKSHMLIRPDVELLEGRKCFEWFWRSVQKVSPRSKCVQLIGNHSLRPHKRVLQSNCPELEAFLDLKSFFEIDGVETIHDPRQPYMIEDIAFTHGWLSGKGKHRAKIPYRQVRDSLGTQTQNP